MGFTVLLKVLVRVVPLLALGIVAEPLSFHPAPGATLTKRLASEWSLHLERMEIAVDGSLLWSVPSMDTRLSQGIVISDTYLALDGAGPIALDREFIVAAQTLEKPSRGSAGRPVWENVHGSSELEGTVVQFRREGGAYTKQFGDSDRDLDYALLGGLTEDMDLRVLLPTVPVSVGDEWEIELTSLPDLLSPGGYFAWSTDSDGALRLLSDALDPALMGELRHVLGAMLEGHVTVQYLGEEGEQSQLGITIKIECTEDLEDLSGLATKVVEESSDWGTIEVQRLDLTFALEATGTAQWDTDGGHILDLTLTGEAKSTLDLEVTWDIGTERLIEVKSAASSEFVQTLEAQ